MKQKKCPTCGEPFRKGKRCVILHFDGSIAAAIVCLACVARSVSLVTPFPRAGLTVDGVELLQRVSDRLRTYLSAVRLVDSPVESVKEFQAGRADAFSTAIAIVQRAISGIEP